MTGQNNQAIEVDPSYGEALNLLIQKFLSFSWCRENLAIPYGFKKSESDTCTYALIAISNFSDLSRIGDGIKSAIAKAGFDCQFAEEDSEKILSIIEELEASIERSEL